MLSHRFRELVAEPLVAAAGPAMSAGFMPCPCPVLSLFSQAQLAYVADIYRVAREMTEAQLRKPARSRIPAFSRN